MEEKKATPASKRMDWLALGREPSKAAEAILRSLERVGQEPWRKA
jgi:hypothetical protein